MSITRPGFLVSDSSKSSRGVSISWNPLSSGSGISFGRSFSFLGDPLGVIVPSDSSGIPYRSSRIFFRIPGVKGVVEPDLDPLRLVTVFFESNGVVARCLMVESLIYFPVSLRKGLRKGLRIGLPRLFLVW
jgi:hypothetical protein